MKLTIKENSKVKVKIEIEQAWEEFSSYYEKAFLSLSKEMEIPGFRKGQAPRNLVESSLNPQKVLIEAASLSVDDLWPRAIVDLAKQKMEVVSQPQIELLKLAKDNEFVFSAEVEILPEIILPDYKAIAKKVEKKEVKVEAKEVDETILNLQRSRAVLADKPEPAQNEDFVEISFASPEIEEGKERKDAFILGKGHYPKEFEDSLVGMSAGQEKDVDFTSDKDKTKILKVKVKMTAVKKFELPEATDDWAKSLGNFENFPALKANIQEGIKGEKEHAEKERQKEEFLAALSKEVEAELPQVLVERETHQMMHTAKEQITANLNVTFEEYLKQINKTEADMEKEVEEAAKRRVKNFLIIREITKKEAVEADAKEIEDRINEMLSYYPDLKAAQKEADIERLSAYAEDEIKQEKMFKMLGL
ncbi:MAG: trigger factor [Candidatus Paceibacterota bacterium]|jgi:trigger factor